MIRLRNVCVNNLKQIDLDIPFGQWVSICGLSGSGKSSLAFDTLYAEGQRRYIESLSPHTRKFLHQIPKPDADVIEGVPSAIAVTATRQQAHPQETVSTATDLASYWGLLFSELGVATCPDCASTIERHDAQTMAAELSNLPKDSRYQVLYPLPPGMSFNDAIRSAQKNGFSRVLWGHRIFQTSDADADSTFGEQAEVDGFVIVDRLKAGTSELSRVRESLEIAFQLGEKQCAILTLANSESQNIKTIGGTEWELKSYSQQLSCPRCQRKLREPEPRLFNFRSRIGACQSCQGKGVQENGHVGSSSVACPICSGSRHSLDALAFRVEGMTIGQVGQLTVQQVLEFLNGLRLDSAQRSACDPILQPAIHRLTYLAQVGLSHLQLNRPVNSLSTGETQRIAMTSCLASTLVNMMYVLDEPSVGLHAFDLGNLKHAIEGLHARQNTIIVVDHTDRMITSGQRIIEIGPGAGQEGGEIVFDGSPEEILRSETDTGDYLAGNRGVPSPENRRKPRGRLRLNGASGHNLKSIDVEFPLGCLCLVTGVSGAGKSSLVQDTLYPAICNHKEIKTAPPLPHTDLLGDRQFDEVVFIDQTPVGRSPRSNPVTYVKAFDEIRRTFAATVDAKTRNIKMGHFSFNVAGGRCDKCEGDGHLKIDMQFMADLFIPCDQCRGTRYRDDVLAVKYRGKSIAEVLQMTVRQAFTFFRGQPKVQARLKSLIDVGLGYIQLGQPANTLSAGEAQRLKLGHYLSTAKSKRVLFLMEEPTSGLHMSDIVRLYDCFETLVSVGHSMIIVEHNLQMISYADWVIDLGPGAADEGGNVVVSGTPEDVVACQDSVTGQFLKDYL